jgi:hypothetical protein
MTANGTAPVVSMRHDATDGDDDACFPRRSNEQATVRNQEARWSRRPNLEPLNALVGEWSTGATHPAFPLWVVSGRTTFEWLQGRHFLIGRSRSPEFPDGLTVLGADGDGLSMRYYDSRASNGSVRRA